MRNIQRLNKDVNKGNEKYTKAKQRCKQNVLCINIETQKYFLKKWQN